MSLVMSNLEGDDNDKAQESNSRADVHGISSGRDTLGEIPKTYPGPKFKEKFPTVAETAGGAPSPATPWRFSPEKNPGEASVSWGPEEERIFQKMQRDEKMRRGQREREENMRREKKEHLLDRQATAREREEKMRRAKKDFLLDRQTLGAVTHHEQGVLFILSYNIDEVMSSQERERVEKMREVKTMLKGRKVKVMLPKLDYTLRGRVLRRYKQELEEILREQQRKLNMPLL